MKKGTVYLVNAKGTNRYKIGYTNRRIEERLAELSGGQSPFPLVVTKTILVEDAHTVELGFHHKFADCRKYGEWFEFDGDRLKEVCKLMDEAAKHQGEGISFLAPLAVALTLLLGYCHQYQPPTKITPIMQKK
ncbi:GIY-YIG nuclease family protein [Nostoc sp. CENA67]|uniref:GIY-YIG nuclease family protein n=1 Tax=Amazonocrinis nigriterrae CENA67 TaxID=2794033 RepID=A0A8J7LBI4_9NOST|nr:GIY-YIG nuclease family protein [Amazonocrinis nigriterrae]MBH8566753.1 GIY-YIG nuclease family protein [Amazonocrinis nigriterrae CENA67]